MNIDRSKVLNVAIEDKEAYQEALSDFEDLTDEYQSLVDNWLFFSRHCNDVREKLSEAVIDISDMVSSDAISDTLVRQLSRVNMSAFEVFYALASRIEYNLETLGETYATSGKESDRTDYNQFVDFLERLADVYAIWGDPQHRMLNRWRSFDHI